jgi:hypothetical protein
MIKVVCDVSFAAAAQASPADRFLKKTGGVAAAFSLRAPQNRFGC